MDVLYGLKDRVTSFFSPKPSAPTAAKTSKTFTLKLDRHSMSPRSKTDRWLSRPFKSDTPCSEASTNILHRTNGGIKKKSAKVTPARRLPNKSDVANHFLMWEEKGVVTDKTEDEDDEEMDLDGSTLLDAGGADEEPVGDDTLVEEDDVEEKHHTGKRGSHFTSVQQFSYLRELSRRKATIRRVQRSGWKQQEVLLYQRLSMRGFEPLLPHHWKMDFPTVPGGLFTRNDDLAFVKSLSGNDFRATKALDDLIMLGPRIRDKLAMGLRAEPIVKKQIESYISWMDKDAGIAPKSYIPLISLAVCDPQKLKDIEVLVTSKLRTLALRWRDRLRLRRSIEDAEALAVYEDHVPYLIEPPILYGIVMCHSMVAVLTYDAAEVGAAARFMGMFDYGKRGHDVWNGFALAIVLCHARNCLLDLLDYEELGMGKRRLDGKEAVEDDPDA